MGHGFQDFLVTCRDETQRTKHFVHLYDAQFDKIKSQRAVYVTIVLVYGSSE